jgi:hypothetical protein
MTKSAREFRVGIVVAGGRRPRACFRNDFSAVSDSGCTAVRCRQCNASAIAVAADGFAERAEGERLFSSSACMPGSSPAKPNNSRTIL